MIPVGTLRLASFNLMSGRSLHDGQITPGQVGEAGHRLDADVLAVQEADRYQPRSGRQDQVADLAESMGPASWSRFEETVRGVPGEPGWTAGIGEVGAGDRTPGFGVALLSRVPVIEWHVLRLAPGHGRFPIVIPARPPRVLWLRDEPRAVVAAVLDQPRMTVACTHLSFMPARSARQLRQVRRWLAQLPGPQVLMGDLNLPAAAVRRLMPGWPALVTEPSFPSPSPRLQLDHVLAHGFPGDQAVESRVERLPISDHCAMVVELRAR